MVLQHLHYISDPTLLSTNMHRVIKILILIAPLPAHDVTTSAISMVWESISFIHSFIHFLYSSRTYLFLSYCRYLFIYPPTPFFFFFLTPPNDLAAPQSVHHYLKLERNNMRYQICNKLFQECHATSMRS